MAKSSTSFHPKWNSGPTTVVRVPAKFAERILDYAHELDAAGGGEQICEPGLVYRTAQNVSTKVPVNVASVPQRSPFRYPGGKTWLVPYIRSWLSRRTPSILIEPFAGGGIVSLTAAFEHLAEHIILVEMDSGISAVWQAILGGQSEWLADCISSFHLTKANVQRTLATEAETQRERAFAVILRNRVQRGGIMAVGAGLVKTGENGRGLASRWYPETLARRIRDIASIRGCFTFIEGDGCEVIRRYADDESVAFFVDPPYTVAARRLYTHWQIDHKALFQLLASVKGDVLLTYDNTREIADLAKEYGLQSEAIAMKNTHHAKMSELLIGRDLSWLSSSASRVSGSQTVQGILDFPP